MCVLRFFFSEWIRCSEILANFQTRFAPPTPNRIQDMVAMEIQLHDLVATANATLTVTAEWTMGGIDKATAEGQMSQSMDELNRWVQGTKILICIWFLKTWIYLIWSILLVMVIWSISKGSEIFQENSHLFDFHLKALLCMHVVTWNLFTWNVLSIWSIWS